MRLTEVVVRFHPYVGGVETTVYELGRRLARRGHAVEVVCADVPRGAPGEVEGMAVHRLPVFGRIADTPLSRGVARAVRATRPDLVHAHMTPPWWCDGAARAARGLRVPLLLTYNNDVVGRGLGGLVAGLYNRLFLPRLLRRAERVVLPNPAYRDLSPWLRAAPARFLSIPWGVDTERFAPASLPSEPGLVLTFLAVLKAQHAYKGLSPLLEALASVRRAGATARLRVGGAGDQLPRYREEAARLGLGDAVDFLGFVPDAELPAFFHSGHVFVLPSTTAAQEGFGLVLLEAMASGRGVLTTPVVGMAAEIREAGAGVLVAPGDVAALADAIVALAADPPPARARLVAMGERGRRLVESRFDWERVTDAYERLLQELGTARRPERV